jgi:hypothetical protein
MTTSFRHILKTVYTTIINNHRRAKKNQTQLIHKNKFEYLLDIILFNQQFMSWYKT